MVKNEVSIFGLVSRRKKALIVNSIGYFYQKIFHWKISTIHQDIFEKLEKTCKFTPSFAWMGKVPQLWTFSYRSNMDI